MTCSSIGPRRLCAVRSAVAGLMLAAGLSFSFGSGAAAAGLLVAADEPDVAAASLGRHVVRSRLVRIDTRELASHVAPLNADRAADRIERARTLDGVVTLDLFPDVSATFRRSDVDAIGDSGFAWVGNIDESPLEFTSLFIDGGTVTGHVQLVHKVYRIQPLGNGLHRVLEIDTSKFEPEQVKTTPPPRSKADDEAAARADLPDTPSRISNIRVLIAYTQAAKQQDPNIVNDIKNAVSIANTAYKNTQIPIKLDVAGIVLAQGYNEPVDAFQKTLDDLDGSNGNVLKNIRELRNNKKADVVSLWRRNNNQGLCGIANLTDFPNARKRNNFAYSIMNWECVSNLSFHHEIGHNMGARHDRFVDPTNNVPYNHGYVNNHPACMIRTVMGYNNACSPQSCTRVNVFSTGDFVWIKPDQTRCVIGVNKGQPNATDNTQRLSETRREIVNYR